MRTDCSTNRYEDLYAPWLAGAESFADRFIKPRDRVLDLCGGTGAVAQHAVMMGCPRVDLLDVNPRWIAFWKGLSKVQQHKGAAEDMASLFKPHSFDVIVCRQALGYLDLEKVAEGAAQTLAPGGRLCFNNFRRPPRWRFKSYEFGGAKYTEIGWHIGKTVWHIQRKAGRGWDLTKFRWHYHTEIEAAMSPYFTVHAEPTEKTYYYKCVVKDV